MIVVIIMAYTGGPHEARLLRKKFVDDEYLVASRPVANESETLTINFGISLLQIREVVSLPFDICVLSLISYSIFGQT